MTTFALSAAACGGRRAEVPASVTFTKDVAPIVFSRCAPCHRPGQVAPFSLLTYEDARARAADIAHVTGTRQMPPWLPDPSDPPFIDERRLAQAEIDTIKRWVDAGAPEGRREDTPPVPTWPSGWTYGTPDMVVALDQPYTLHPGGHDSYRNVIMPMTVPEQRFVRAVEFNPGTRVVHHAVIRIDRTGLSRRRDLEDPEPGFDGMVAAEVQDPDGHFIGWAPGRGPIVAPEGMPWRLDRGSELVVELHLMPGNKPEPVKPTLALYFTDKPPVADPVMLIMGSKSIDIPAGKADYIVEDKYTLPVAADLLSVYPHAHYLGKEMVVRAALPDGTSRQLLRIPQWNFQWQQDYRYRTPVFLPQGTTITMRYSYDNSEGNTMNPHRPVRRVTWGPQSSDEMGNLGVQVLPRSAADARRLVTEFAHHAAESDLDGARILLSVDPHAGNETLVGSSYVRLGRYAEALPHLERALRLDPKSASAANFLAGALLALGRHGEAIERFRQATALSPRDEHLRFNLARALQSTGDRQGAAREMQRALAINNEFAEAHQELGVLLFESGQVAEAIRHLSEAVRLSPGSAVAHSALGGVLAAAGRTAEAETHLRQALVLDPGDDAARQNLSRLQRQ